MDTAGWFVIVAELNGTYAYPVERWNLHVQLARLEPVFFAGMTTRDYPYSTSFRLVHRDYVPADIWQACQFIRDNPGTILADVL